MRRSACLFAPLVLAVAACGDRSPIPTEPLSVVAGATEVAFGRAFPLEVVRTWDEGSTPAPWSDAALAPVAVRLEETTRRARDGRVEERRTYRAYAFAAGPVTVPHSGQELTVAPAVDPADPGPVERPGGPLERPFAWVPWLLGAAAVLAAAVVLGRRRGRPAPAPAPAPAPPPPRSAADVALRGLAQLRERTPEGRTEEQAFHVEASRIVRAYLAERFGEGVERSSEEVVAARGSSRLAGVLAHCDRVKFARHAPAADERARMLDDAAAYIEETAR